MTLSTRRHFLKISGLALGGLVLQIPFPLLGGAQESLPDFPREIGEAYKKAAGTNSGIAELHRKIAGMGSREQAQAYVNRLIEEDYAAGHCFSFNTWQLSHTEGRLCALAIS